MPAGNGIHDRGGRSSPRAAATLVDDTGHGTSLHIERTYPGGGSAWSSTETEDYTTQEVFISGTIAWP